MADLQDLQTYKLTQSGETIQKDFDILDGKQDNTNVDAGWLLASKGDGQGVEFVVPYTAGDDKITVNPSSHEISVNLDTLATKEEIGNLDYLNTESKKPLVAAVNEVLGEVKRKSKLSEFDDDLSANGRNPKHTHRQYAAIPSTSSAAGKYLRVNPASGTLQWSSLPADAKLAPVNARGNCIFYGLDLNYYPNGYTYPDPSDPSQTKTSYYYIVHPNSEILSTNYNEVITEAANQQLAPSTSSDLDTFSIGDILITDQIFNFETSGTPVSFERGSVFTVVAVVADIFAFVEFKNSLIDSSIKNLEIISVSQLPEPASEETMGAIYLVPKGSSGQSKNIKDEYITIRSNSSTSNSDLIDQTWQINQSVSVNDFSNNVVNVQVDFVSNTTTYHQFSAVKDHDEVIITYDQTQVYSSADISPETGNGWVNSNYTTLKFIGGDTDNMDLLTFFVPQTAAQRVSSVEYSWEKIGDTRIDLTGYEEKANKITSISSQSTNDQYPSAKCVYDAIKDNEDFFWVDYGTTPLDDILVAVNEGKIPVCQLQNDGRIYYFSHLDGQDNDIILTNTDDSNTTYCIGIIYEGVGQPVTWRQYIIVNEVVANKVTSISNTSTNVQYPSAKCVYDNLANKVNIAQGAGNANKLVVTDNSGNITVADAGQVFLSYEPVYTVTFQLYSASTYTYNGVYYSLDNGATWIQVVDTALPLSVRYVSKIKFKATSSDLSEHCAVECTAIGLNLYANDADVTSDNITLTSDITVEVASGTI